MRRRVRRVCDEGLTSSPRGRLCRMAVEDVVLAHHGNLAPEGLLCAQPCICGIRGRTEAPIPTRLARGRPRRRRRRKTEGRNSCPGRPEAGRCPARAGHLNAPSRPVCVHTVNAFGHRHPPDSTELLSALKSKERSSGLYLFHQTEIRWFGCRHQATHDQKTMKFIYRCRSHDDDD